MKTAISTSRNIYLVKFRSSQKGFIIQNTDLLGLLKANPEKESRGLEYIKIYDPIKQKFKILSKTDLKNFSNWETELTQILKKLSAI